MRAGIFFSIFGKGPFGLGILSVFSNKLGKKSQMKMFLIFYKGYLKLHVVINYFISFDSKVKEEHPDEKKNE